MIKKILAISCLLTTTSLMALETPDNENIYSLHSSPGDIRGFVSTGESFHAAYRGDTNLIGLDVFSHVKWEEYFKHGDYTEKLIVGGYANAISVVPWGVWPSETAHVCFDEPIPLNAKTLTYDQYESYYSISDVQIPSDRNDRFCLETERLGGIVEFMVIIE